MKLFLSTQKTFAILGFLRPQAFDNVSINIRNVVILFFHVVCFTISLMFFLKSATQFREYSDGVFCITSEMINSANAIVIILKASKIFKLIDDFEAAILERTFVFYF